MKALQSNTGHDRLLDLVEDVDEEDSFAILRLLQVRGVHRFGHIIIFVPPFLVHEFADARDEAVASTLAAIQQDPPPPCTSNMRNAKIGVLTPKSAKMRQNAPKSAHNNAKIWFRTYQVRNCTKGVIS